MALEDIPKTVGMIYAILVFIILSYLFHKDKFVRETKGKPGGKKTNNRTGYVVLLLTAMIGFLVFAPMFPNQFQLIVLGDTGELGVPLQMAIVGLLLFIILTLVSGRVFCGYLCPVGAVQEIAYRTPKRKLKIKNKTVPKVFRVLFLVALIAAALKYSMGLLEYLGIKDFFMLDIESVFALVFTGFVVASLFVYRPFCRFFCPYGVFLSLVAGKSRYKLRRTDACIDCGMCERACPTNEAKRTDSKQECYLCYRCKVVCPVNAIEYSKKTNTAKAQKSDEE